MSRQWVPSRRTVNREGPTNVRTVGGTVLPANDLQWNKDAALNDWGSRKHWITVHRLILRGSGSGGNLFICIEYHCIRLPKNFTLTRNTKAKLVILLHELKMESVFLFIFHQISWNMDNNSASMIEYWPILKFLSLAHSTLNVQKVIIKDLRPHLKHLVTLPCEILIFKICADRRHDKDTQTTVTE